MDTHLIASTRFDYILNIPLNIHMKTQTQILSTFIVPIDHFSGA